MGGIQLLEAIHASLYPERCVGCDVPGVWLCDACIQSIPVFLERCPAPRLPSGARPSVEMVHAVAPYRIAVWNSCIRAIKYEHATCLVTSLVRVVNLYRAQWLDRWMFEMGEGWTLIPIPTQEDHMLERGGDHMDVWRQATLDILPCVQDGRGLLQRKGEYRRSHADRVLKGSREAASRDIFFAGDVQNTSIILLDDVYTTGSTVQAAAAELIRAGAARVEVLVGALS